MASTNEKLNLLTEDLLSLSQAAREIPGRPHAATVWRWHKRGVNGIKLETIRIGGQKIFTTRQAITRFLSKTQEPVSA